MTKTCVVATRAATSRGGAGATLAVEQRAATQLLPPGDFRDWDAIEAGAREIAGEVAGPEPVG